MKPELRVGQGTDRHGLERGLSLILGGVTIDSNRGTLGHSDGDVLTHAIIDALLGAAGLGDIGQHFPENEAEWKDVHSLDLLETTLAQVHDTGWVPVNIDATVRLESVKLSPYRQQMIDRLSKVLPETTAVNVKFTTAEGVGPVGRDQAIEATAICLLGPAPS